MAPSGPFRDPRSASLRGSALISTAALVLAFAVSHQAADAVLLALALAAGLESIFGYCLGCKIFGLLMRAGLVPEKTCAECADISARLVGRP